MAQYTIVTTRKQEIGLKFSYDTYADKLQYPTQEEWFQYQIDITVTNSMYAAQQQAQLISFDQSFATVPETSQPKAKTEIEVVITSNGGTIVPAGNPAAPGPPIASNTRGNVPSAWGTSSNPIQIGGTDTESAKPSGRDGEGDNETETGEGMGPGEGDR